MNTAYVGVHGHVLALDKRTGQEVWKTNLSGAFSAGFVSLATDGELVFAHTGGKLYCLDAKTGRICWKNDLPGLGYETATICAAADAADSQIAFHHEQQARSA